MAFTKMSFLVFTFLRMTCLKGGSLYYFRASDCSPESVSCKSLGELSPSLFQACPNAVSIGPGSSPWVCHR